MIPARLLTFGEPMPTDITRRLEFDAGHRVYGHEGKCNHIHGHRYKVDITLKSDGLDKVGRVFDFAWIKDRVGLWIDVNWDHGMLLNSDDPVALAYSLVDALKGLKLFKFHKKNPTAEVIAEHLFYLTERLIPEVTVVSVTVWETPSCSATYPSRR